MRKLNFAFTAILLLLPSLSFAQADRDSPEWARMVMEALAAAYPGRIEKAELWDGDWAVLMPGGTRYFFCGGRLLPEELRGRAGDYSPQPFYRYAAELPPWKKPSAEEAERFKNRAASRSRSPVKRSPHFFDALWQAGSRAEAERQLKEVVFLGSPVRVHQGIAGPLALVEERIRADALRDSQVRAWINSISMLDCWNWRVIAETQTRSFHAYAVAVDILPKSLGGKETYWLWAARTRPEWWDISYAERLHPPPKVIKAFESQGFVWGGKWLFFDTMHFEYRPEIFLLNSLLGDECLRVKFLFPAP